MRINRILFSYGHYDDDDGYGDYHGGGYPHGYSDYHHEGGGGYDDHHEHGYDDHHEHGYSDHDEHGYGHSDHSYGHKRKGGEGHYSYKNVNQHGDMKYYKSPDTHYHEDDGYYEENYPEYDDYQHDVYDKIDRPDKKVVKHSVIKSIQQDTRIPRQKFDYGF